jgi:hypothetical protein
MSLFLILHMARPKKVAEVKETIENEKESHNIVVYDTVTRSVVLIDSKEVSPRYKPI